MEDIAAYDKWIYNFKLQASADVTVRVMSQIKRARRKQRNLGNTTLLPIREQYLPNSVAQEATNDAPSVNANT